MCVQFATNQPAPKGNMVVHCGGKMMIFSFLLTYQNLILLIIVCCLLQRFSSYNIYSLVYRSKFFVGLYHGRK
jgi:phosphatidylserine synthase